MKIIGMIARILLGAIFAFFGSNLLFHFLPNQPMPPIATQYMTALFVSHYIVAIGMFQVIGGLLLLFNRYVPLGLVILAPIIVNIMLVHFLMAPSGIPMACIVALLWALVYWRHRSAFRGIYWAKMEEDTTAPTTVTHA
jgi:putative oxidoreductase